MAEKTAAERSLTSEVGLGIGHADTTLANVEYHLDALAKASEGLTAENLPQITALRTASRGIVARCTNADAELEVLERRLGGQTE